MSGGPVDMAPINAVLEKFGHEVGVLTEKVRALEGDDTSKMGAIDKQNKEISGLKVVIDKQKGEISGLKGEVNEQVQKISDQMGEISGLKKTMDEQAQKISELQKQLTTILNLNQSLQTKVLAEERETLTIDSAHEPPKMKRIGGGFIPPSTVHQGSRPKNSNL